MYALDLYPQNFADKMFRHQRLDFPNPAKKNPDLQRNQEKNFVFTKYFIQTCSYNLDQAQVVCKKMKKRK